MNYVNKRSNKNDEPVDREGNGVCDPLEMLNDEIEK